MEHVNILRGYGLFDAKVPRYTSYPPANRFEAGTGQRHHHAWLEHLPVNAPVSIYAHIPFCRRLCWFCACRTQGTKTRAPVEAYVDALLNEIDVVATRHAPKGLQMRRLHLGGGTPTLLTADLMERLLSSMHAQFKPSGGFEFSVEVDPTEAPNDVLDVLSDWNMARASIGVQDFDPRVQEAIGRVQSFDETHDAAHRLRRNGVRSLNVDVLYGLPFQTAESLMRTLDQVVSLRPDRLALYGYAHVPHVSKRQVMIPGEALPEPEQRYGLSQIAKDRLVELGYVPLGIDHFALPHDSLTHAAKTGRMTRNFQGYTDDPCETLIGFGASAISKFKGGYSQNAVSTSAYHQRVAATGTAAHKGVVLTRQDQFISTLIDALMCNGRIDFAPVRRAFPDQDAVFDQIVEDLLMTFPKALSCNGTSLTLAPEYFTLARMIAARIDRARSDAHLHSLAV